MTDLSDAALRDIADRLRTTTLGGARALGLALLREVTRLRAENARLRERQDPIDHAEWLT